MWVNMLLVLIHICTPPYVHASIAIDSMDAGCNVVVEKPMATCLAECDAMLEAEKRNHVTLACIAQNRFRNSVFKLKKVADSGLAGKICCAHVDSYWWRGHSYYDLWWRGLWEKEGGLPILFNFFNNSFFIFIVNINCCFNFKFIFIIKINQSISYCFLSQH